MIGAERFFSDRQGTAMISGGFLVFAQAIQHHADTGQVPPHIGMGGIERSLGDLQSFSMLCQGLVVLALDVEDAAHVADEPRLELVISAKPFERSFSLLGQSKALLWAGLNVADVSNQRDPRPRGGLVVSSGLGRPCRFVQRRLCSFMVAAETLQPPQLKPRFGLQRAVAQLSGLRGGPLGDAQALSVFSQLAERLGPRELLPDARDSRSYRWIPGW